MQLGVSCNGCVENHFRPSSSLADACVACECNADGAASPACNAQTGQCPCKQLASGRACDTCAPGAYGLGLDPFRGCRECNCNLAGSVNTTCDVSTGQCVCKEGRTGRDCADCDVGFYLAGTPGQCEACDEACGSAGCIASGKVLGFACRSCAHASLDGVCVMSCPPQYWNDNGTCRSCHAQCQAGCTGEGIGHDAVASACVCVCVCVCVSVCVRVCPCVSVQKRDVRAFVVSDTVHLKPHSPHFT